MKSSKGFNESLIFPEKIDGIPFSYLQETPIFNFNKKYTVTAIMYLNGYFLMVNKRDRVNETGTNLIGFPSGISERRQDSKMKKALQNASFPKEYMSIVNNLFSYIPAKNAMREVLEETGILIGDMSIFGHRKSVNHPDQLIFEFKEGFIFDDSLVELRDFFHMNFNFSPIGTSQHKDNSFVILSIEEVIKSYNRVIDTHKEFLLPFLFQIASSNISIANLLIDYNLIKKHLSF